MATGEKPKVAVLAIHGMGTHLPLSGIQDVVQLLGKGSSEAEYLSHLVGEGAEAKVSTYAKVRLGEDLPEEIHIYEANYSAIPKGKAGLVDVILFLLSAGWNGLDGNNWKRWILGKSRDCRPQSGTHAVLVFILGVLISCLGLNAAFVAELSPATAFAPMDSYRASLCVAMVAILVSAVLAGALIFWSKSLSDKAAKPGEVGDLLPKVALAGYTALVLMFGVVILAGLYIVLKRIGVLPPTSLELTRNVGWFMLVRCGAAFSICYLGARLLGNRPSSRLGLTGGLLFVFLLLAYQNEDLRGGLLSQEVGMADFWILGGLFLGLSLFARSFLVDYGGDVCAYVGGSRASKFAEVREAVQCRAMGALLPLLEQGYSVVVLAHSLGSIVGYDAVNRALLAQDRYPGRIAALITFGCPLDKIAYLFKTEDPFEDSVRNRLVASRQPLIDDLDVRKGIPWWNIQARYDIVGGRLDFYNAPKGVAPGTDVVEVDDKTNLTPIVSHSSYSAHPALSRTLRAALATLAPQPALEVALAADADLKNETHVEDQA